MSGILLIYSLGTANVSRFKGHRYKITVFVYLTKQYKSFMYCSRWENRLCLQPVQNRDFLYSLCVCVGGGGARVEAVV